MARFRIRRGINIKKVVRKIFVAVITLYVGGTILVELGNIMNGSCSPFYRGLTLIGWTIGAPAATTATYSCTTANTNTINATSGTGVLTVVGIVAIASIVLEFISVSW